MTNNRFDAYPDVVAARLAGRPALDVTPCEQGEALKRQLAKPQQTRSEAINDWQRTTFGHATPERAWGRFYEEFEEMLEADCEPAEPPEKIAEEAADVVITLAAWVKARTGLDLAAAVEAKMQICRGREWEIRGDGTGYHVKAGEKTGGAE